MKRIQYLTIYLVGMFLLSACATANGEKFSPESSYLKAETSTSKAISAQLSEDDNVSAEKQERFRFIPPMKLNSSEAQTTEDIISQFSNSETIQITANNLPLKDYIHQVLGEQLAVSYILADEVKNDTQSVTLNLQEKITKRKLFTLTEELLTKRNYVIRYDDNIFYIHRTNSQGSQGDMVYGYGKKLSDVPQSSLTIIQMVPFEFGVQTSLGNTLVQLLGVKVTTDFKRGNLIVQGKRKDILRALDLIQLMDKPAFQNRQIGLFKTVFISTDELVKKLSELLTQEGITVGTGNNTEKSISIIQLEKQGMLVFFANNQQIIERTVFWAKQVDKPIETLENQYFMYHPQYSRAVDMGESLHALIGNAVNTMPSNTSSSSTSLENENRRRSTSKPNVLSSNSNNMRMVVDERANALIFYTSGDTYQQLLPLIKRLDILPKQIMLEVMIAEVSLTDEFKQGVEFAFSKGNYGFSTMGAFMGEGFGGLSYLLQGPNGQLAINLLQTNSLVNILSRPTLVVRDGVNASISVGTDIPVVGETSSDPINGERQTTQIEYRKTGVELSVLPTINAQGVILMEIKQKISNQVASGATNSVNPAIFERTIETEVVAESGQTIMLGGLISENKSNSESQVPFFGDLPIIGNLFKAKVREGDKTELVVLVTPRIIEDSSEWGEIIKNFNKGVTQITINE